MKTEILTIRNNLKKFEEFYSSIRFTNKYIYLTYRFKTYEPSVVKDKLKETLTKHGYEYYAQTSFRYNIHCGECGKFTHENASEYMTDTTYHYCPVCASKLNKTRILLEAHFTIAIQCDTIPSELNGFLVHSATFSEDKLIFEGKTDITTDLSEYDLAFWKVINTAVNKTYQCTECGAQFALDENTEQNFCYRCSKTLRVELITEYTVKQIIEVT